MILAAKKLQGWGMDIDWHLPPAATALRRIACTSPALLTLSTLAHTHRASQNPDGGDASGLGTRWGVSEGGLDGLGWVRNLIRFTESHPVHVPLEDRGGGEVLDPIQ